MPCRCNNAAVRSLVLQRWHEHGAFSWSAGMHGLTLSLFVHDRSIPSQGVRLPFARSTAVVWCAVHSTLANGTSQAVGWCHTSLQAAGEAPGKGSARSSCRARKDVAESATCQQQGSSELLREMRVKGASSVCSSPSDGRRSLQSSHPRHQSRPVGQCWDIMSCCEGWQRGESSPGSAYGDQVAECALARLAVGAFTDRQFRASMRVCASTAAAGAAAQPVLVPTTTVTDPSAASAARMSAGRGAQLRSPTEPPHALAEPQAASAASARSHWCAMPAAAAAASSSASGCVCRRSTARSKSPDSSSGRFHACRQHVHIVDIGQHCKQLQLALSMADLTSSLLATSMRY